MTRRQNFYGVACAGNWIVDLLHTNDHWPQENDLARITKASSAIGGGAANVAFDLQAFGVSYPILPIGLIGKDEYGDRITASCLNRRLSTEFLYESAHTVTAHTHVMTVQGHSRTFFYHGGANDQFGSEHVPLQELRQRKTRLFYLGYLNLLEGLCIPAKNGISAATVILTEARSAGMITCVDLASANTHNFRSVVESALPAIDVLLCNEVEAAHATGLEIAASDDRGAILTAAKALLGAGVKRAVVLHTPRLAIWKSPEIEILITADPLATDEIVSPVGAGDAFAAGVLHGLHEGWNPTNILRLAMRAGAASLRGRGSSDEIPSLKTLMH
jgi:sugar/nucleoside kinase (ribokinase family)